MFHTLLLRRTLVAIACLSWGLGHAQFSAGISPPRFEIAISQGKLERKTIEIVNPTPTTTHFKVYTSDWSLSESGQLAVHEELRPGSCRPWVALERKEFSLPPGGKIRYRFEVQPPAEWDGAECRLMIFFEGNDPLNSSGPIAANGRLGVTLYVRPEGVELKAEMMGTKRVEVDGKKQSALLLRNAGLATIRVSGTLEGRDAAGKRWYLSNGGVPILPGSTRPVALSPVDPLEPSVAKTDVWTGELDLSGTLRLSESGNSSLPVSVKLPAP